LNIVIRERATIFQLFARKDQSLLIRRNALLVLDLGLDVFNGVGRLNIERNGLARECLDENLKDNDEM
jgi:hypothetical protein